MDKSQALSEWLQVSQQLKILKAREMELRFFLAGHVNPEYGEVEGTFTENLPWGAKLVLTSKFTRSVDTELVPEVNEELERLDVQDVIFPVSYKLNKRNYDSLKGEARSSAEKAVTTKPSTPQLSYKE